MIKKVVVQRTVDKIRYEWMIVQSKLFTINIDYSVVTFWEN